MSEQKILKLMSWPIRLPSSYFNGFLMINHPPCEGGFKSTWGIPYEERDDEFLLSLCDYFEERLKADSIDTTSVVWGSIVPTHAEFIEHLRNRDCDKLHDYLSMMFTKPLTFGLAQGEYFYKKLTANEDDIQTNTAFAVYDKFLCLLEALGIVGAFSPEQYLSNPDWLKHYSVDMDRYLDEIENMLGCQIQAPKYQGGHFCLQTERHGYFSDRDIMALGVAIRIQESYWKSKDISICDVGSGLGYLPFYLKQLGFTNITHVDIPTITVAAKYFMKINDPDFDLKYISPKEFDGKYDLVINFDGLTTYNRDDADEYASKISKNCKHFLSINREIDEFKVSDIMNMNRITRNPFWYRRGYIEEDYVVRK